MAISKEVKYSVPELIINLKLIPCLLSMGYNGMPTGCNDDRMPWERKGTPLDTKYLYVCHAEFLFSPTAFYHHYIPLAFHYIPQKESFMRIYNTGTNLCVVVLASLCRKKGNPHKEGKELVLDL